ncbi:hypothetical protein [Herbiconiux sp. A18JL235]|uniref:Glycerophosphoryl diester phosphodiesterase membrane domain-containing protein n=1 Tax=Herbiconiux sp. A18JL235 TaxID=3152363 RepID=A0AB39BKG0_9MICO
MSENDSWTAPGAERPAQGPQEPTPGAQEPAPATPPAPAAPTPTQPAPAQWGPPTVPPAQPAPAQWGPPTVSPAQPAYGQYAPPPAPQAQPAYGQYAPPPAPQAQPAYGHYAPPPAPPAYGQYAPPQAPPAYGQYAAPTGVPAYAQQGYAAPAPQGWAPPPKPGLIPLRPLGFGTLMGAPFQVVRRNPKATFGSGLLIQLIIVVVTALLVGAAAAWAIGRSVSVSSADYDSIEAGNVAVIVISALIPLVLSVFASALLQGVLVLEVARGTLGEKRRLGELWKAAFRRILPLTGWLLLSGVAIVIALGVLVLVIVLGATIGDAALAVGILVAVLLGLGFLVLFAWLGTKFSVVPSVIVLERVGVFAAMRRSWGLTAGMANFWRTLGVIVLVYLILNLATQLITTPFSFLLPIVLTLVDPNNSGAGIGAVVAVYLLLVAVSVVMGALASVVQAATVAVIYIDLRMRKEGLDIELVRFVESRHDEGSETWPDPYQPGRQA